MKNHISAVWALSLAFGLIRAVAAKPGDGPDGNFAGGPQCMDAGWRFHRGGAQGATAFDFDDSSWRVLDLPHDWSIEDLPGTDSPFSPDAISQVHGGFTTGGTGWYRKSWFAPEAQKGRRMVVRFDGVYMNAKVWVNGVSQGEHPYGYTPFQLDITSSMRFGSTNLIAVKVSNEGENSRWYSGSGIYRHVWLQILDPVHVDDGGVFVTTPHLNDKLAEVRIQTRVRNQETRLVAATLVTRLLDNQGREVAQMRSEQALRADGFALVDQTLQVGQPAFWSVTTPVLYTNVTEVLVGDRLVDRMETPFGIRSLSWDAARGFQLNGQAIKLKGGCLHHDNGPLGAKSYDRAEERKVELLKASGYNAVRCAHNPPSPAFLDACDRLGMLVIDEAFDMWDIAKNPADYHLYFKDWWEKDMTAMVERDRNHPSVILWSIGNEIPNKDKPKVVAVARLLASKVRELDSTRPITAAVNDLKADKDPYFSTLDIAGYNYAVAGKRAKGSLYESDHGRRPERVMLGTESYPLLEFESWMEVLDHPYVIGDFVWTAWDYIGEASIGWRGYTQSQDFYPWNLAYCGDIDICGWKRPQSYYRDALWKPGQVAIFVTPINPSFPLNSKRLEWSKWHFNDLLADWTWPECTGQSFDVTVYSSCDEVELFQNGQSLGRKPTNRDSRFTATWKVPYQPGRLLAVGYDGGREKARAALATANKPASIRLESDRNQLSATGEDLAYITAEMIDDHGLCNPKAADPIDFEIAGPGVIVGVGNSDPTSTESYQKPRRTAWHGRCLVIVKSGTQAGIIKLKARAGASVTSPPLEIVVVHP